MTETEIVDDAPESMPVEDFFRSAAPKRPEVPDEAPESIPASEFFDTPETASRPGAFARGFAEGVIPAGVGMGAGLLAGAGTGMLFGSSVGPIGTLVGGVAGGLLAGYGATKGQDYLLEQTGVREGPGWFGRRQQQTDEALFPYTRAAGGITAALPTLRPGGTFLERGVSGVIGMAGETVSDYATTGHVDPVKVGMGGVAGFAFPNINRPFGGAVSKMAPMGWRSNIPGSASHEFVSPEAQPSLPPDVAGLRDVQNQPGPPTELDRQIVTAAKNRDVHQPDDLAGLHKQWSDYYDGLVARRDAVQSGKLDTEHTPQGGKPADPKVVDLHNDATTTAAGNAAVNTPPPVRPEVTGNIVGAAGNKQVADGAIDESKVAARTAPGEPTQPTTKVAQGHVAPDEMTALKAAQPKRAGPTPEEEAAAVAQGRQAADAQPSESGQRLEKEFPTVAKPGEQPKPFTEQQRGTSADDQMRAEIARMRAENEALRAQQPQPEPAATAPVTPPQTADTPVMALALRQQNQSQAVNDAFNAADKRTAARLAAPPAAQAAVQGRRPAAPAVRPVDPIDIKAKEIAAAAGRVTPDKTDYFDAANAIKTAGPKPFVAPEGQAPRQVQPVGPNAQRPKLTLAPKKEAAVPHPPRGPAEVAQRLQGVDLQMFDVMQLGRIAQSLQRSGIGDKPTVIKRIQKALDDFRKATGGAIDIGPVRPVKGDEGQRKDFSNPRHGVWDQPGQRIADSLLRLSGKSARWALSELNRLINRAPTLLTEKPNVALARKILRDRATGEPEGRPANVPDPRGKIPLERTRELPPREPLPELPKKLTMEQLGKTGYPTREAPYSRTKLEKWYGQLPDEPIAPRQTNVTRPHVLRHETPEPPYKPKPSKSVPADEAPAPGKRAPRLITTDTGEVRMSKVFGPEPPKLHGLDKYTPEEKMKFIDALDRTGPDGKVLLSPEQKTEALSRTLDVPKAKVLANLDRLPEFLVQERQARTKKGLKLSTGGQAEDLNDKAHKEGILAAHEKAVTANPRVKENETLGEALSRAKKIVDAANAETNRVVAELTKAKPKFRAVFTGKLNTAVMDNPPPASKVVDAARKLLAHPNEQQKNEFVRDEILAHAPEPDEGRMRMSESEPEATAKVTDEPDLPDLPRYTTREYPGEPTLTSDHADLVKMLNNLSDEAHDMMQGQHGEPIGTELAKPNLDPVALRAELLGSLFDAQAARMKHRHALPDTLVKTTPVSDRAGIAQIEQTGRFDPTNYNKLTKADREKSSARTLDPDTKYYKDIADAALKFFRNLRGDERGALDVTKIFKWIDKHAEIFKPDREPMVPTGMTRLYRAEADTTKPSSKRFEEHAISDWQKDLPETKAIFAAEGRWFAKDMNEVDWYTNFIKKDSNYPPITKYVDVPTSVVDQYRVDNLSGVEGKKAREFSRRWDKEFFLPREIADKRVTFEPEDMGLVDHLRRLWSDESGALDISRLRNILPDARSRARSEFDPTATEQTKNYAASMMAGDKFGHAVTRLRNSISKQLNDGLNADAKASVKPAAVTDAIGRAIENRTESRLTPEQQKWMNDNVVPRHKEYDERYIRVRDLKTELGIKHDMPEPVDLGPGFVRHLPRREVRLAEDVDAFDPRFTNTNPLGTEKPGVKERAWFNLQAGPNGAREFYHINDEGNMVAYKDGVAGNVYRAGGFPKDFNPGQVGSKYLDGRVVTNASIEEIMRHGRGEPKVPGGSPVKLNYERNPMFVLSTAIKDLIHAETSLKFIKELRDNPDFQKNIASTREEAIEKWGDKKVAQTILEGSTFKDKWFPKPMARALDDLVKQGFNYNGNSALEAISRFNQSTMKLFYFIGPVVHPLNEADKLIIGRGYDNLNPSKTMRNFKKGYDAVRAQGDVMEEIMIAGGNPMFMHAKVSRYEQNSARLLGVELAEKHWKYDPLFAKAGINTKAKYWEPAYQGSNKGMWWSTDVMYAMLYHDMKDRLGGGYKNWEKKYADLEKLNNIEKPTAAQVRQRDELNAWTKDLARKSVIETEKIIDGYTIPSTFGRALGFDDAGRVMQQIAADPITANFARYSYGLIKTLVNIGKNMAGKNENLSPGHSAALGFSQAATMMGMISVLYPALSAAYSKMPWAKPESEVELRGVSRIAALVPETAHKGIKDTYSKIAARVLSPSVGLNYATTSFVNRDNVGRPILESAGPGGWAAVPFQAAGHAFDQFVSPAGQVSRAYAQEGGEFAVKRFIESNFGAKTPSDAQVRYEQKRHQTEERQGKSREKHPRGVFDIVGNEARKLVRGYEEGGFVTATETGVIPTSRG